MFSALYCTEWVVCSYHRFCAGASVCASVCLYVAHCNSEASKSGAASLMCVREGWVRMFWSSLSLSLPNEALQCRFPFWPWRFDIWWHLTLTLWLWHCIRDEAWIDYDSCMLEVLGRLGKQIDIVALALSSWHFTVNSRKVAKQLHSILYPQRPDACNRHDMADELDGGYDREHVASLPPELGARHCCLTDCFFLVRMFILLKLKLI